MKNFINVFFLYFVAQILNVLLGFFNLNPINSGSTGIPETNSVEKLKKNELKNYQAIEGKINVKVYQLKVHIQMNT